MEIKTSDQNTKNPIEFFSIKNSESNTHVTLSEFLAPIIKAVKSVSEAKWVTAEISSLSGTSHLYLDLIETDENGTKIAQLRAMIWSRSAPKLIARFAEGTGGEQLRKGLKVLLKLKSALSPQYGLSATIEDIDPTFTLGVAAAQLIALRNRLVDEGKYSVQKGFKRPTEFTSIAIICPSGAAGLGDFKAHADPLEKLQLCKFSYFTAIFQGESAGTEILGALRNVYTQNKTEQYDCVVILRGGGSQADLAWLNNYDISSAISKMPIPVLVAVGHERDSTILDEIANVSFHTPSKAIGHISETILSNAQAAIEALNSIHHSSLNMVALAAQSLDKSREKMISTCENGMSAIEKVIANTQEHVTTISHHSIERTEIELKQNIIEISQNSYQEVLNTVRVLNQNKETILVTAMKDLAVIESEMFAQKNALQDNAFNCLKDVEQKTKSSAELVMGLGPKRTLKRGFTIARSKKGKILTSKNDAKTGETVLLQFADGNINATIQ